MCTFITLAVPRDRVEVLRSLAPKHRLVWAPPGDGEVRAALPSGWVAGWLTDGHCACDLIKWHARETMAQRARREGKYRAKGWSEAKIARALGGIDARAPGECASEALLRLLDDALADTPEIVFLAATYGGPEDGAEGPVANAARVDFAELRRGNFRFEPRSLVRIHASPR